jgi:putative ABC transport system permease protein
MEQSPQANAQGFAPGSRFSAILNGRKRELTVVGIGLSPEFVYAIGPDDIMPDDRRFGIIWMSERHSPAPTISTAHSPRSR